MLSYEKVAVGRIVYLPALQDIALLHFHKLPSSNPPVPGAFGHPAVILRVDPTCGVVGIAIVGPPPGVLHL